MKFGERLNFGVSVAWLCTFQLFDITNRILKNGLGRWMINGI
jgi:hypothetical protein